MELSSPAFDDGARIPERYTCDGEDLSPPLRFQGVPDAARSLAIIMDDPDAPRGVFVHWLIWNIPARVEALPEGIPPGEIVEGLAPAAQGRNGFGQLGYRGPCPPPGPEHRYRFRLTALDTILSLSPGVDRARLEEAMEGHVMDESVLTATYGR